jgi:hypothetical protein
VKGDCFSPKTCSVHVENEGEEDVVEDIDADDDDANNDFLYLEILPHNNPHVREIIPNDDII